ncbi:MAG: hypothetical protein ACK52I_34350 [Pseudomonadota bacterium]
MRFLPPADRAGLRVFPVWLALLACWWSAGALAHGLRLHLQADASTVRGQAFYADGSPAGGARVSFPGPQEPDAVLVSAVTDADGRFSANVAARGVVRDEVEDEEGHRAEGSVTLVPPATSPSGAATSPGPAGLGTPVSADTADALFDDARLRAALRAELQPLREQVARLEHRLRLADALAGVGFLVGLAGAWALFRARRST